MVKNLEFGHFVNKLYIKISASSKYQNYSKIIFVSHKNGQKGSTKVQIGMYVPTLSIIISASTCNQTESNSVRVDGPDGIGMTMIYGLIDSSVEIPQPHGCVLTD